MISSRSLDALSDSKWQGSNDQGRERVVIIRPNTSAFQVVSPKEHEIPLELMRDVNPFSVT